MSIQANFFQNLDACILHNFVQLCQKHKINCVVRHDQFAIPYNFAFALLPLVAESILVIDWKKKLSDFCQENDIFRENIQILLKESEEDLIYRKIEVKKLQDKLRNLVSNLTFEENYREILTNSYFIKA